MIIAVVAEVAFDVFHEKKIKVFLQERKRTSAAAQRLLGTAYLSTIAAKTVALDIATFGEFCNKQRRVSHVLMFYGFVTSLITTLVMVFIYPASASTPIAAPVLWNIGALMTLMGGYWFFFLLRVNVVHDGHSLWRLERADLFISHCLPA